MVISMYYINYFFVMSIFGHLMETILFPKMSSGILFSYWTPIYGIGSLIILFIYNCVHKTKYKGFKKAFILFGLIQWIPPTALIMSQEECKQQHVVGDHTAPCGY